MKEKQACEVVVATVAVVVVVIQVRNQFFFTSFRLLTDGSSDGNVAVAVIAVVLPIEMFQTSK